MGQIVEKKDFEQSRRNLLESYVLNYNGIIKRRFINE